MLSGEKYHFLFKLRAPFCPHIMAEGACGLTRFIWKGHWAYLKINRIVDYLARRPLQVQERRTAIKSVTN